MNSDAFSNLMNLPKYHVHKQNTVPMSPVERLPVTMRYLAAGNSFETYSLRHVYL